MISRLMLPMLLVLTVLNLIILWNTVKVLSQTNSISVALNPPGGSVIGPSIDTTITRDVCPCDVVAVCYDPNRNPATPKVGAVWQLPADSTMAYRNNFKRAFTSTATAGIYNISLSQIDSSIFIPKNVLNTIFQNDLRADGIECHIGYDNTKKRFMLIVRSGVANYNLIAPTPSGTSNTQVYSDRIYCPTQCN